MAIDDIFPISPVPSDATLRPDQLPFTAFGQFGEEQLDLRVFEQDIYWVNIHGEPFLLTEMSQDYLMNVLKHLYDNMETYFIGVLNKTLIEMAFDKLNGIMNGEALSCEMGTGVAKLTTAEWLASTPLVRKLNSLIEG